LEGKYTKELEMAYYRELIKATCKSPSTVSDSIFHGSFTVSICYRLNSYKLTNDLKLNYLSRRINIRKAVGRLICRRPQES